MARHRVGSIASGLFMSKVAVPRHLAVGVYLSWRSLHDLTSKLVLALVGLHAALNWDHLAGVLRRLARRSRRPRTEPARGPFPGPLTLARRSLALLAAAALVTVGAWSVDRLMPPVDRIEVIDRAGHLTVTPPPPDLARLQPGEERPSPDRGGARLATNFLLLGLVGVAGRRLLRLRLD